MTFEELLRTKIKVESPILKEQGKPCEVDLTPDFRVAVQTIQDEGIHFIIHPLSHSGDTLDFIVKHNRLIPYEG